jgi:hypothetical protein
VALPTFWPRWKGVLLIVKPETVVGWHPAGFRLHWRFRSRACRGHRRISGEIRAAIDFTTRKNPSWGAQESMENS